MYTKKKIKTFNFLKVVHLVIHASSGKAFKQNYKNLS